VAQPQPAPDERVDDEAAAHIRAGILTLAGVLNTVLPQAANHTAGQDAQACRTGTS
jgi:hypothetical protein